jgi:type IV pilus assembly protein PilE
LIDPKARRIKMKSKRREQEQGFTLVELMIVVVIVAILAAFAVPNYMEYVRRGHRADAKAGLLQLTAWMQQQYGVGGHAYPLTLGSAPTRLQQSPSTGTAKYLITLSVAGAQSFTLQAAPTGSYSDPNCGVLTLTHNGLRTKSGTESLDYCWNR